MDKLKFLLLNPIISVANPVEFDMVRSKPLTPTSFLQLILAHSWSVVARV